MAAGCGSSPSPGGPDLDVPEAAADQRRGPDTSGESPLREVDGDLEDGSGARELQADMHPAPDIHAEAPERAGPEGSAETWIPDGQTQDLCGPACAGKECGPDGCGGQCGTCPANSMCTIAALCQCLPACAGKQCGDDGCGGLCGTCQESLPLCQQGLCVVDPGNPEEGCTEAGKQIFLVTESQALLRFEPLTPAIVVIGQVDCPAAFGATPFSMAVDRSALAWVLYNDGTLWRVKTENAKCADTDFVPGQLGFDFFGMGFSTDSPVTTEETLFIAGGSEWEVQFGGVTLGTLDTDLLTVTEVAPLAAGAGGPELTGNRSAELWGFFPEAYPPRISRIDKLTAAESQIINLPPEIFSNVQAWAFANWGGSFYVFFEGWFDGSSGIWQVLAEDNVVSVIAETGYTITGAGVSTCAPTETEP